ncbi:elongation factor Ts, mitochondrial [Athalia rosae]|uniref:elongation factor Ts, mitochondrial n=1 Tax=Athalia rosae TaxID=37344 RepID=UPI002033C41D|nr:elongation factor Ts, mitochondrial [Athalia rosae]
MIAGRIFRYIHTNNSLWQASNKALLSELRRKTGYTFANCKKALQLHENDIKKAEQWLMDQAQTLGWSKATKLEGRATQQGLIAVVVHENHGALVEVNCETDFVARNKYFQSLVATTASAALKYASTIAGQDPVNKASLDSDTLKQLPASDGKSLADHSALVIGNVGENLCIRRALCVNVKDGVSLAGYSHPAPATPSADRVGKYASIVAFSATEKSEQLGRQLCQHVIGMNPSKIGQKGIDEPNPVPDDETTMIYQDFLLDPNITVEELLNNSRAQVLDFARYEAGEAVDAAQDLKTVEMCG